MKNAVFTPMPTLDVQEVDNDFPDEAELAAIRSWYAGLDSRETVARYLPQQQQFSIQTFEGCSGYFFEQ